MRILIFLVMFMSCFLSTANADYVVLYDKQSKEIIHIADEAADLQIAETDKDKLDVQEMNGSFEDVELESAVQDYKLVNGKFVLNVKKISDRENEKEAGEAKETKRQADLDSAKIKLMALGLTSAEVNAFVK